VKHITEARVEDAVLDWLGQLGHEMVCWPDLVPDGAAQERDSFEQVDLTGRPRDAAHRLSNIERG